MDFTDKNIKTFAFLLASHTIFGGHNFNCGTFYEMIKEQQTNVCPFKSATETSFHESSNIK